MKLHPPSSPYSNQNNFSVPETRRHKWWVHILLGVLFSVAIMRAWRIHFVSRLAVQLWERVDNPEAQFEAEIFAGAIAALQLLQFLSCTMRREHLFFQRCAWVSYYMPVPLAACAIGVMLRFQPPYWLVAIFFATGHTDTIACYSLHHDKMGMRGFAKQVMSLAYLIWFLLAFFEGAPSYHTTWHHAVKVISILLGFVVFFLHLKIQSSPISISELSSIVANRTKKLPRENFVVAVGSPESYESAESGCTSYDDIVCLSTRFPPGMEQIALSSGLFLHLVQRYHRSDHFCANPAFKGLLQNLSWQLPNKDEADRQAMEAFELVEVQLSFMFDYLFSAHSSPSLTYHSLYVVYSLSKIIFLCTTYFVKCIDLVTTTPRDLTTTFIIIFVMWLELLLLHRSTTPSKWFLVSYMCNIAKGPSHSIIYSKFPPSHPPHQANSPIKLGQYSFLENLFHDSMEQRFRIPLGWSLKKHHTSHVYLSKHIMQETMHTLSTHGTGVNFLTSYMYGDFAPPPNQRLFGEDEALLRADNILIWHIATSYIEIRELHDMEMVGGYAKYHFDIATTLSRYCAYLVAFLPELLPGNSLTTKMVLKKGFHEAEKKLGDKRYYEMHSVLSSLVLTEEAELTTFGKGVSLGRQLEMRHVDAEELWKIIAKCWMDILIEIAQSGNMASHIENLARGREFVTHLWACFSNIGVHDTSRGLRLQPPQAKVKPEK